MLFSSSLVYQDPRTISSSFMFSNALSHPLFPKWKQKEPEVFIYGP